ncbi:hypothetical protein ACA910_019047 [Epithemia clementina (nom. ined.)]
MIAAASLEVSEPPTMGLQERAGSNSGEDSVDGSGVARRGGAGHHGVESLGEALAGVSLGGTTRSPTENAFSNFGLSGSGGGGDASNGTVTVAGQGSGGAAAGGNGTTAGATPAQESSSGWGNFADVTVAAESAFGNGTTGNHHHHHSAVDPSARDGVRVSGTDHAESLQLFLSRDPSQSLGDDVFSLSHPNLPTLANGGPAGGNHDNNDNSTNNPAVTNTNTAFRLDGHSLGTGLGGRTNSSKGPTSANGNNIQKSNSASVGGGAGNTNGNSLNRGGASGDGGRTESPASAVTAGTTSTTRSASSYNNLNNGVGGSGSGGTASSAAGSIQAFPPYDSSLSSNPHMAVQDYSSAFMSGGGPPPPSSPAYNVSTGSFSSPYSNKSNKSYHQFHHQPHNGTANNDYMPANVPPQMVDSSPAQAGQVLYMAVQSPDGRGQVLQPVQMVQLPGKQMAYVVAGPAGMPPPDAMGLDPYGNGAAAPSLGAIGSPDIHQGRNLVGGSNGLVAARGMPGLGGGSGYGVAPTVVEMGRTHSESRPSSQDASADGARSNSSPSVPGGQFHADPLIASLYASPQRPPLDALLGQVRRLSRDQVGCRLVQQALDEEGPMAASLILQEGLPFWGEAMVDPFGNYLFQKVLEKVTLEERIMLVKSVSTRLVNASLNLHGTRSVQKVVELCAADEQIIAGTPKSETGESSADILTEALSPAAARLCIDSHGNHVIQRIILKLGPKHSEFVFDSVAASVGDVARHRHGCCVIQRCLDSAPSEARSHLVRRIVEKALELMQDAYGNYVVQYVLDVCSDEDVHAVCESVVGKVNLLAIQKFSSNVMEKCLERCSERVKECYMKEMSDPERVRELMMDPFGNYVVQRALSVATHAQAIRLVEAMRPHLVTTTTHMGGGPLGGGQRNGGVRNTAGGRRIIAKICRRFPNFSLTAGEQDLYRRNHHHHPHHPNPGAAVSSPMGGNLHHHHNHHHHHQPSPHDELYSRNKGRYQSINSMSNVPPGGHPLTAAAGPAPHYAAVGGPPHHQAPPSFLRSPVPPDIVGLRGGSAYGAPPPPQTSANSYYNPLGIGGGPLGGIGASAHPYYDQFNTNDGSGIDGGIGGTYM